MTAAMSQSLVWRTCHIFTAILFVNGLGYTASPKAYAVEPPKCVDPSLKIELVASEPQIVTPVSCRFDNRGRLFVVESHTHFPPSDYDGPKHDLIKILDDPDGDGSLDRIRVFHQGTSKTMSMAIGKDNSIYLATRASIIRVSDTDGDDVADKSETLMTLETAADYPHNGLSGLLLEEPEGKPASLSFGMGENFGEPYTLRGSDGRTQVGKGEGGNIFQCNIDGGELKRIATGFWNPFGICRDEAGRLLMVDNDADAMPPCRIVHVLPQADYGFEFRFGRAGTHPLQAWNGELPGTLPMVAGTGEAPCAILSYRGQYWVTSWGDNRLERYTPMHVGATVRADRDVAVLGDAMFRPVDMAVAPDGSMYVTDWVDRSYNVHRKGRIWRIHFAAPQSANAGMNPSEQEKFAEASLGSLADDAVKSLIQDHADPFLSHLAAVEASKRGKLSLDALPSEERARVRLATLIDQRWKTIAGLEDMPNQDQRSVLIESAMRDAEESVRLAAVRWAAETGSKSFLPSIEKQLERPELSQQMLAATAAAISYLQLGKIEAGGFDALTRQTLIGVALDDSRPASLRQMAIGLVPPNSPQWPIDKLKTAAKNSHAGLARAAARHLVVAASTNNDAKTAVQSLIDDDSVPAALKEDLGIIHESPLTDQNVVVRPSVDDIEGWLEKVGQGGDAERGWRVFFGASRGKCSSCHLRDGRGAGVGPDLTSLTKTGTDRKRLFGIHSASQSRSGADVHNLASSHDGWSDNRRLEIEWRRCRAIRTILVG
jgi:putative membrane-bound dehydrogenase-like protein